MALEKVWLALHPGSQWSGFTGNSAIYLIDHAISKGWGVYKVSSLIEGDHATDDDETSPYNRKTGEYCSFKRQSHQPTLAGCTRRFQETLNGLLKMNEKMDHWCKTFDNDSFRKTKSSRSLHKKRDAATKKYVETLDVSELLQFTAPLRHSTQGGYNWNFVEFLHWVRPYWEAKVEDLTPKETVHFTSDYTNGTTFAAPNA